MFLCSVFLCAVFLCSCIVVVVLWCGVVVEINFYMFMRQEFMNKGYHISTMQTIEIACGIADALSGLHNSFIAHRDVKSANIMVFSSEFSLLFNLK
jgi:serine/threonine protein kinase